MQQHDMTIEQNFIWWAYMVAAIWLPYHYLPQIRKFLRGEAGVGDWCIRSDMWQLAFRVPALAFSVVVLPSLPLFLSISLDMCGRIGRILAARASQRRFHTAGRAAIPGAATLVSETEHWQAPQLLPALAVGAAPGDTQDSDLAPIACGTGW